MEQELIDSLIQLPVQKIQVTSSYNNREKNNKNSNDTIKWQYQVSQGTLPKRSYEFVYYINSILTRQLLNYVQKEGYFRVDQQQAENSDQIDVKIFTNDKQDKTQQALSLDQKFNNSDINAQYNVNSISDRKNVKEYLKDQQDLKELDQHQAIETWENLNGSVQDYKSIKEKTIDDTDIEKIPQFQQKTEDQAPSTPFFTMDVEVLDLAPQTQSLDNEIKQLNKEHLMAFQEGVSKSFNIDNPQSNAEQIPKSGRIEYQKIRDNESYNSGQKLDRALQKLRTSPLELCSEDQIFYETQFQQGDETDFNNDEVIEQYYLKNQLASSVPGNSNVQNGGIQGETIKHPFVSQRVQNHQNYPLNNNRNTADQILMNQQEQIAIVNLQFQRNNQIQQMKYLRNKQDLSQNSKPQPNAQIKQIQSPKVFSQNMSSYENDQNAQSIHNMQAFQRSYNDVQAQDDQSLLEELIGTLQKKDLNQQSWQFDDQCRSMQIEGNLQNSAQLQMQCMNGQDSTDQTEIFIAETRSQNNSLPLESTYSKIRPTKQLREIFQNDDDVGSLQRKFLLQDGTYHIDKQINEWKVKSELQKEQQIQVRNLNKTLRPSISPFEDFNLQKLIDVQGSFENFMLVKQSYSNSEENLFRGRGFESEALNTSVQNYAQEIQEKQSQDTTKYEKDMAQGYLNLQREYTSRLKQHKSSNLLSTQYQYDIVDKQNVCNKQNLNGQNYILGQYGYPGGLQKSLPTDRTNYQQAKYNFKLQSKKRLKRHSKNCNISNIKYRKIADDALQGNMQKQDSKKLLTLNKMDASQKPTLFNNQMQNYQYGQSNDKLDSIANNNYDREAQIEKKKQTVQQENSNEAVKELAINHLTTNFLASYQDLPSQNDSQNNNDGKQTDLALKQIYNDNNQQLQSFGVKSPSIILTTTTTSRTQINQEQSYKQNQGIYNSQGLKEDTPYSEKEQNQGQDVLKYQWQDKSNLSRSSAPLQVLDKYLQDQQNSAFLHNTKQLNNIPHSKTQNLMKKKSWNIDQYVSEVQDDSQLEKFQQINDFQSMGEIIQDQKNIEEKYNEDITLSRNSDANLVVKETAIFQNSRGQQDSIQVTPLANSNILADQQSNGNHFTEFEFQTKQDQDVSNYSLQKQASQHSEWIEFLKQHNAPYNAQDNLKGIVRTATIPTMRPKSRKGMNFKQWQNQKDYKKGLFGWLLISSNSQLDKRNSLKNQKRTSKNWHPHKIRKMKSKDFSNIIKPLEISKQHQQSLKIKHQSIKPSDTESESGKILNYKDQQNQGFLFKIQNRKQGSSSISLNKQSQNSIQAQVQQNNLQSKQVKSQILSKFKNLKPLISGSFAIRNVLQNKKRNQSGQTQDGMQSSSFNNQIQDSSIFNQKVTKSNNQQNFKNPMDNFTNENYTGKNSRTSIKSGDKAITQSCTQSKGQEKSDVNAPSLEGSARSHDTFANSPNLQPTEYSIMFQREYSKLNNHIESTKDKLLNDVKIKEKKITTNGTNVTKKPTSQDITAQDLPIFKQESKLVISTQFDSGNWEKRSNYKNDDDQITYHPLQSQANVESGVQQDSGLADTQAQKQRTKNNHILTLRNLQKNQKQSFSIKDSDQSSYNIQTQRYFTDMDSTDKNENQNSNSIENVDGEQESQRPSYDIEILKIFGNSSDSATQQSKQGSLQEPSIKSSFSKTLKEDSQDKISIYNSESKSGKQNSRKSKISKSAYDDYNTFKVNTQLFNTKGFTRTRKINFKLDPEQNETLQQAGNEILTPINSQQQLIHETQATMRRGQVNDQDSKSKNKDPLSQQVPFQKEFINNNDAQILQYQDQLQNEAQLPKQLPLELSNEQFENLNKKPQDPSTAQQIDKQSQQLNNNQAIQLQNLQTIQINNQQPKSNVQNENYFLKRLSGKNLVKGANKQAELILQVQKYKEELLQQQKKDIINNQLEAQAKEYKQNNVNSIDDEKQNQYESSDSESGTLSKLNVKSKKSKRFGKTNRRLLYNKIANALNVQSKFLGSQKGKFDQQKVSKNSLRRTQNFASKAQQSRKSDFDFIPLPNKPQQNKIKVVNNRNSLPKAGYSNIFLQQQMLNKSKQIPAQVYIDKKSDSNLFWESLQKSNLKQQQSYTDINTDQPSQVQSAQQGNKIDISQDAKSEQSNNIKTNVESESSDDSMILKYKGKGKLNEKQLTLKRFYQSGRRSKYKSKKHDSNNTYRRKNRKIKKFLSTIKEEKTLKATKHHEDTQNETQADEKGEEQLVAQQLIILKYEDKETNNAQNYTSQKNDLKSDYQQELIKDSDKGHQKISKVDFIQTSSQDIDGKVNEQGLSSINNKQLKLEQQIAQQNQISKQDDIARQNQNLQQDNLHQNQTPFKFQVQQSTSQQQKESIIPKAAKRESFIKDTKYLNQSKQTLKPDQQFRKQLSFQNNLKNSIIYNQYQNKLLQGSYLNLKKQSNTADIDEFYNKQVKQSTPLASQELRTKSHIQSKSTDTKTQNQKFTKAGKPNNILDSQNFVIKLNQQQNINNKVQTLGGENQIQDRVNKQQLDSGQKEKQIENIPLHNFNIRPDKISIPSQAQIDNGFEQLDSVQSKEIVDQTLYYSLHNNQASTLQEKGLQKDKQPDEFENLNDLRDQLMNEIRLSANLRQQIQAITENVSPQQQQNGKDQNIQNENTTQFQQNYNTEALRNVLIDEIRQSVNFRQKLQQTNLLEAKNLAIPPVPKFNVKDKLESNQRNKRIYWEAIQDSKINQTVWQHLTNAPRELNQDNLKKLFTEDISLSKTLKDTRKFAENIDKSQYIVKKLEKIEIMLRSTRISIATIQENENISDIERNSVINQLNSDQMGIFIQNFPTQSEIQQIKEHQLQLNKSIQRTSLLIQQLIRIPDFIIKLQYKWIYAVIQEQVTIVNSSLDKINIACETLIQSENLKLLLKTIVTVGNYLNMGMRGKDNIKGFKLRILTNLQSIKSVDDTTSILQYVITEIQRNSDKKLNTDQLFQELQIYKEAAKLNLAQIQIIIADSNKIVSNSFQHIDQDQVIQDNVLIMYQSESQKLIANMEERYMNAKQSVKSLIQYFGEDFKIDSFELVEPAQIMGIFVQFLIDVTNCLKSY